MNEPITGERLITEDFRKVADDNLVTALNSSTFTLKEKNAFFKKKWLHEHIAAIILSVVAWIGVMVWLTSETRGDDMFLISGAVGGFLAVLFYLVHYHRMMVYVENRAYQNADIETGKR